MTRPPPALTARQLGQRPGAPRSSPPPLPTHCSCRGQIPRCEFCRSQALRYHGDTLGERALDWATRSARARWDGRTWPVAPARWPPRVGRVAELAAAKVADLARDPAIAEMLAVYLHLRAKELWERWQRIPEPPWVAVERGRAFSAGPAPRPKARP